MPLGNAVVPLSEEVSLGTLISLTLIPVTEKSVNVDDVAAAEEYPFPREKAPASVEQMEPFYSGLPPGG